jgi:prepilin-type N-terminal cleavage/methylation domain-containing protein
MKRAFTLIEIMASLALFALVVILGATIVSSASSVSRTAVRRTEVREEARSVFDRMMLDLSTAVRFNTYEIRTSSATNGAIALLSSSGQSGTVRLQRIDYYVATNGLVRSVRNLGWNDSQDLSAVDEGPGELLSPAVGCMATQSLMSDGTISATMDTPSARVDPRPKGIIVGLAVINPNLRRNRDLTPPTLTVTTNSPWVQISADAEREGWRAIEKTFRLP